MMINAEEEKQLLNQLGVVESTQGTHYPQTLEFGRLHIFTALASAADTRKAVFFSVLSIFPSIHMVTQQLITVMIIQQCHQS